MSKVCVPNRQALTFGTAPVADNPWTKLVARYSEPQRHYHTTKHIWEMLSIFSAGEWPLSIEESHAVLLAVWYHDAIYDSKAGDNEEQSAQLAKQDLTAVATPGDQSQMLIINVMRLVRSTATHEPQRVDEQILSDLDLAILGAERKRYREYMVGIRAEYEFVPMEIYIEKRIEILQGFLDRPQIYYYLTDLEERARVNLNWEITHLVSDG